MECNAALAGSVVAGVLFLLIICKLVKRRKDLPRREPPSGKVLLHQFPPSPTTANPSPMCLKLETFIRMAKIPYEVDYSPKMSSKGKKPWIECNGQSVADSNFCIRFLTKEFGVDVDEHLSDTERATAHLILTTIEENTYWVGAYYRWHEGNEKDMTQSFGSNYPGPVKCLLLWMVQKMVRLYMYCHGIGRHSKDEICGIAERDLRAVSTLLGKKKFLFGDQPCVADAAVFGLVANFLWGFKCPQGELIKTELINLERQVALMKETYFPDWDNICTRKRGQHTARP